MKIVYSCLLPVAYKKKKPPFFSEYISDLYGFAKKEFGEYGKAKWRI